MTFRSMDAATGGYILPFLNPDKKWDFRLSSGVLSMPGHKFDFHHVWYIRSGLGSMEG